MASYVLVMPARIPWAGVIDCQWKASNQGNGKRAMALRMPSGLGIAQPVRPRPDVLTAQEHCSAAHVTHERPLTDASGFAGPVGRPRLPLAARWVGR